MVEQGYPFLLYNQIGDDVKNNKIGKKRSSNNPSASQQNLQIHNYRSDQWQSQGLEVASIAHNKLDCRIHHDS